MKFVAIENVPPNCNCFQTFFIKPTSVILIYNQLLRGHYYYFPHALNLLYFLEMILVKTFTFNMYNSHIAADCAQSSYHLSLTSNNNMFIFELVSTSLLLLTRYLK